MILKGSSWKEKWSNSLFRREAEEREIPRRERGRGDRLPPSLHPYILPINCVRFNCSENIKGKYFHFWRVNFGNPQSEWGATTSGKRWRRWHSKSCRLHGRNEEKEEVCIRGCRRGYSAQCVPRAVVVIYILKESKSEVSIIACCCGARSVRSPAFCTFLIFPFFVHPKSAFAFLFFHRRRHCCRCFLLCSWFYSLPSSEYFFMDSLLQKGWNVSPKMAASQRQFSPTGFWVSRIWQIILVVWNFIKKLICCGFCRDSGNSQPRRLLAARGVKIVRLPEARRPGCDDDRDVEKLLGPDFSPYFKRKYLEHKRASTKLSIDSDSDENEGGKLVSGCCSICLFFVISLGLS